MAAEKSGSSGFWIVMQRVGLIGGIIVALIVTFQFVTGKRDVADVLLTNNPVEIKREIPKVEPDYSKSPTDSAFISIVVDLHTNMFDMDEFKYEVFIDGRKINDVPVFTYPIGLGVHEVWLKSDAYIPEFFKVDLKSPGTYVLEATMYYETINGHSARERSIWMINNDGVFWQLSLGFGFPALLLILYGFFALQERIFETKKYDLDPRSINPSAEERAAFEKAGQAYEAMRRLAFAFSRTLYILILPIAILTPVLFYYIGSLIGVKGWAIAWTAIIVLTSISVYYYDKYFD